MSLNGAQNLSKLDQQMVLLRQMLFWTNNRVDVLQKNSQILDLMVDDFVDETKKHNRDFGSLESNNRSAQTDVDKLIETTKTEVDGLRKLAYELKHDRKSDPKSVVVRDRQDPGREIADVEVAENEKKGKEPESSTKLGRPVGPQEASMAIMYRGAAEVMIQRPKAVSTKQLLEARAVIAEMEKEIAVGPVSEDAKALVAGVKAEIDLAIAAEVDKTPTAKKEKAKTKAQAKITPWKEETNPDTASVLNEASIASSKNDVAAALLAKKGKAAYAELEAEVTAARIIKEKKDVIALVKAEKAIVLSRIKQLEKVQSGTGFQAELAVLKSTLCQPVPGLKMFADMKAKLKKIAEVQSGLDILEQKNKDAEQRAQDGTLYTTDVDFIGTTLGSRVPKPQTLAEKNAEIKAKALRKEILDALDIWVGQMNKGKWTKRQEHYADSTPLSFDIV